MSCSVCGFMTCHNGCPNWYGDKPAERPLTTVTAGEVREQTALAGAPSCSSELAAAREFFAPFTAVTPFNTNEAIQHGRELLRMVDELTEAIEDQSKRMHAPATEALNRIAQDIESVHGKLKLAWEKERDELRAKLVAANVSKSNDASEPQWLQDVRAAVAKNRWVGDEDKLLRMVDELTKEREETYNANQQDSIRWLNERDGYLRTIEELREKLSAIDDPTLDCTEGAHPAWWRGHDDGARGTAKAMLRVAKEGKNGVFHPDLEEAATAIEELRAKLAEAEVEAESRTSRIDELCDESAVWKRRERVAEAKLLGEEVTVPYVDVVNRVRDLEAKLAEEKAWSAVLNERWTAEVEHARALQDKLANAESRFIDMAAAASETDGMRIAEKNRAEVAETRVRELEAKLAKLDEHYVAWQEGREK